MLLPLIERGELMADLAAIGWKVVVALVVLAMLGEILELLAAAGGTARAGGSRRGAALALVGSIIGGLLGVFIGVPSKVSSTIDPGPLMR